MSNRKPNPLMVTYGEAGEMLGVCSRVVWQLVKDGRLNAVKIGRSVRIPVPELERFVADHLRKEKGGAA